MKLLKPAFCDMVMVELEYCGRRGTGLYSDRSAAVVAALCQLPAAQQLTSSQVLRLLQGVPAAVAKQIEEHKVLQPQRCQHDLLPDKFNELPAVQKLRSEQVLQLLRAAVEAGYVPTAFCRLVGAAAIGSAAVLELITTALATQHPWRCIDALLTLPGVGQMAVEAEFALLQAAAQTGCVASLKMLKELPSAQQLSTDQELFMQLVAAAVHHGGCKCAKYLCKLQQRSSSAPHRHCSC
jgi:hypothetical protein